LSVECFGDFSTVFRTGDDFWMTRKARVRAKAAVNAPQSKRFAKFAASAPTRQRLDCGGFSAAFARTGAIECPQPSRASRKGR
jgi:hypothetical protein